MINIDFKCIDLIGNWYYWEGTDKLIEILMCRYVDFSSFELLVGGVCVFL